MRSWWSLISVASVLLIGRTGQAQTYSLTEAPLAKTAFRYKIELDLTGEIKVQKDGKQVSLKQSATATHDFFERVLDVDTVGLAEKNARFYQTAKVVLSLADEKSERTLPANRCLMVAQRYKDRTVTYCPNGPLTREQRDVTEHFDTLSLTGLLPGKAVPVGDTWKLSSAVVHALCQFDGLTEQNLTCKLEQVKDDVAQVSLTGSASGIESGAFIKQTIRGTYRFNLKAQRLTELEWKQTDERDQGPASPAANLTATTKLTRSSIAIPEELNEVALVPVPEGKTPPEGMLLLAYRDHKERYELLYSRDWQMVGRTDEHLVLRLIDQGDFVAQATITPWKSTPPGKHLTGKEFQEAMAVTPNWQQSEVLQSEEVKAPEGRWVYRVAALGELDGLKVMQYFYLIASTTGGQQVVVSFTLTPAQAQKLGSRDLSLIHSLKFPGEGKGVKTP
jgi:hypothetical protein